MTTVIAEKTTWSILLRQVVKTLLHSTTEKIHIYLRLIRNRFSTLHSNKAILMRAKEETV
jgi:hypothetical protein